MKPRMLAAIIVLCLILPFAAYAEQWSDPAPIPELNTFGRDAEPWISADGKTMYFSSDRVSGQSLYKLDIFVTRLVDGHWTTPERLPEPLNDPTARDGHPSLTLDGRYMYFHSSREGGFGGTDAQYGLDIWMSENIDGVWQQPVVLPLGVNTTTMEVTPTISVDGQTLIFSSGDPGTRDLYVAHKVDGVWQNAVNMGAPFHSDMNEDSPSLSYSGKYLFLSRGGAGDGVPSDIYRSVKIAGIWQEPVLLPAPVNTGKEEQSSIYNDCTNTLYFYTSRFGLSWDLATTQWQDFSDANPCSQLIIPEGQWRVRVTLLEASAGLSSDIYLDQPISQLLIRNSLKNVGKVVSTPFLSAEELVFRIHIKGQSMGLGEYDHYSNSEFAQVERTDPLRYLVKFEDLPADQADWDYNDTVLLVELVGVEVNIWESENYMGEAQVVQETPPDQDTVIGLAMVRGDVIDAVAEIPGAGLSEPSYGVVTEGDPALYDELLGDAPFDSTGDFIKVELTSGQEALAGGSPVHLSLDVLPLADGNTIGYKLYRLDPDTASWQEVASQAQETETTVVADSNTVGLFALGFPKPTPPLNIALTCGQAPGPAGLNTLLAALVLIVPLLAAGLLRRGRKAL